MGHIALPPPPFPLKASFLESQFHDAQIYRSEHGGLLPDTAVWRYLEERWSLDPGRFEHWHPRIGPWLADEYRLTHEPQSITPPVPTPSSLVKLVDPPGSIDPPSFFIPPDPPPSIPPTGGDPDPPPVATASVSTPEPSSWVLLTTSCVAALVASRFRKR